MCGGGRSSRGWRLRAGRAGRGGASHGGKWCAVPGPVRGVPYRACPNGTGLANRLRAVSALVSGRRLAAHPVRWSGAAGQAPPLRPRPGRAYPAPPPPVSGATPPWPVGEPSPRNRGRSSPPRSGSTGSGRVFGGRAAAVRLDADAAATWTMTPYGRHGHPTGGIRHVARQGHPLRHRHLSQRRHVAPRLRRSGRPTGHACHRGRPALHRVRITGGDPDRIETTARYAAEAGLEVWFSPFPCELSNAEMLPLFTDCAERAERLRRDGTEVVLVTGCEISVFARGYLPGDTLNERIPVLAGPGREAALQASPTRSTPSWGRSWMPCGPSSAAA